MEPSEKYAKVIIALQNLVMVVEKDVALVDKARQILDEHDLREIVDTVNREHHDRKEALRLALYT